jgi:hypothetical protein
MKTLPVRILNQEASPEEDIDNAEAADRGGNPAPCAIDPSGMDWACGDYGE